MTEPDTGDLTQQRVLREQVAALYATALSSTIADAVLAWALCALFWWQLRDPLVFVWLGLHTIQVLRYPLIHAYFRDPQAAARSAFWARRQWRELLYYSATWGLAPWLFMPADDMPMTTLLMLIMLGLISGGVPSVAPRWASVLAFVLPMMAGLISALLWRGDTTHLFLAACAGIYTGAMLHFARRQHLLLTASLQMRFEKEALAEQLAGQMAATQRASEEKTRFFAAASHDLRQPLHAIALFGAVLDKELQGQPTHTHAQRLMGAVHSLGTSLDTMLDVSRLDAGVIEADVQDVPLSTVLQALHPSLASRAEERELQLRLRATPVWVRTDPHLLQRLLGNLIENAIKYTAHGGVLVVARPRGAQVWIDVVDTGIGIAPEHADRVFDEFYQVDNPGRDRTRGLGIGLSIVRRLSQLLDHPVRLRSWPGHGTRFRVTVPRAKPTPEPTLYRRPATLAASQALPRRVLLVDDEADITDALSAFLQTWGVASETARDEDGAALALQAAAARQEPFDALLCDYRLAEGADGLAASQRLRARFGQALPVLLITGETAPDRLQRVRDSGVPVLFKPVDPERLLQALALLRR
ncbi:MAG: hybrid sensor histidine kinase/response regulator [Hydrogenophaga sp.]|uniref:ATP-binding response regulator n=1 Tax=Hydrogenophaga sp. TaxID=1904254 RepID=UPI0025C6D236|nr:hybrid sensor histidine kinase/response regulator [Hydrogenophaga sp.]MBU7574039.1 hybrid sensor histidine kinase/response regulator [Hydrogenophaga sp.]